MENLSRGMQQKVALARALLTRRSSCSWTSRRRGSIHARSSRCRTSSGRSARTTTRRSSCARTTSRRRRRSRSASGSSTADACSSSSRRRAQEPVWRGHARGGVLRGDGARVRGGGRRGRRPGGDGVSTLGTTLRAELVGAGGVVERNYYLTKRYIWWDPRLVHLDRREHAHDRLHREGHRGPGRRAGRQPGRYEPADRSGRLGVPRRPSSSSSWRRWPWERWEGTIEYTFMAPLPPPHAPRRHGRLLGAVRTAARDLPVHGVRVVLRPLGAGCGVHGRPRRPRDRLDLVPRDR